MKEFAFSYLERLKLMFEYLDLSAVEKIVDKLEKIHINESKIYILGNGGSAATASHMANDLSVGLKLRSIRNFNVESLGDNSAICTAIANDIGYENIFYAQIKNKIKASTFRTLCTISFS